MSITDPIEATLRDGRCVTIRPIRRDDAARTTEFIDGLSEESKHALFLGGIAHLGEAELRRLCDPDDASDVAHIATAAGADGRPRQVGVCRYASAESAAGAEISFSEQRDPDDIHQVIYSLRP